MYTTGDVAGAVRVFLGLLRGSSLPLKFDAPPINGNVNGVTHLPSSDKVFLDDFRVAISVRSLSFS